MLLKTKRLFFMSFLNPQIHYIRIGEGSWLLPSSMGSLLAVIGKSIQISEKYVCQKVRNLSRHLEQILQCSFDCSGGYGQLTTLYEKQQSLASHCSIITNPAALNEKRLKVLTNWVSRFSFVSSEIEKKGGFLHKSKRLGPFVNSFVWKVSEHALVNSG